MSKKSKKAEWYEAKIELDMEDKHGNKFKRIISIVHNLPPEGAVNSMEAAFDNWLNRTDEFTSESLVKYINDKAEKFATGHKAMTEEQYKKLINTNEELRDSNQLN